MSTPEMTELSVQGESIQQLSSQYTAKQFLVNRRYQRKLVWAVEEKSKLVDSVLKRLPIPLILLAEAAYKGVSRLEVIDGLQRLNALFSFIENEFPVDGKYFDLQTLADTKFLMDEGRLRQMQPVLDRALCRDVTIHVVSEGVGVQGFPVTAVRIASNAVRPCLRAVAT